MTVCEWCGKESTQIVKLKIGTQNFKICSKCADSFKERKCIDCGAPITLNKFDKGRCLKCAQLFNSRVAKAEQDMDNAYEGEGGNIDDELYTAWLEQRPLDSSKLGHIPE